MVRRSFRHDVSAMSPSTRSKPASASSPETGRAKGDKPKSGKDKPDKEALFRHEDARRSGPEAGPPGSVTRGRAPLETIEVELEVSRQRWITWTIGGIIGGILLVLKLGTVGVWVGYVLIALGLWRAYQLAMSYVHPPGKFVISEHKVSVPRGVHRPRPLELEPSAITAAYFLRRSVPWNRSAPVLVIELGDRALAFPRDWFSSETDQRHIIHALLGLRGLPKTETPAASTADAKAEAPKSEPGPVTES